MDSVCRAILCGQCLAAHLHSHDITKQTEKKEKRREREKLFEHMFEMLKITE